MPGLCRRVRSATACYCDLGERVVPAADGGSLVHFLSDQQWVVHWLLYAGPDDTEAVIATPLPYGFMGEGDDGSPYDWPALMTFGGDVEACVCADSFSEFMYRLWIENEIYFQDADGISLTDEQRRYCEHYKTGGVHLTSRGHAQSPALGASWPSGYTDCRQLGQLGLSDHGRAADVRNIRLLLEYDGANFAGWQLQPRHRTVEGELRRALTEVTGSQPPVYAAGRTDAGAHAEGQVVNFHYQGRLAPTRIMAALNARLPVDVAVVRADEATQDFHARYSALWRRYRYRYLERQARPALDRDRCWHLGHPLDVEAMAAAVQALTGRHDWTTFCSASEPAADRVRTIRHAAVNRVGRFVELDLLGDGFLRGMVRSLAGGLAEIGRGRREPDWLGAILRARDRRLAPKTAPAGGLTLVEVLYDGRD